jgi:hypothetical protein
VRQTREAARIFRHVALRVPYPASEPAPASTRSAGLLNCPRGYASRNTSTPSWIARVTECQTFAAPLSRAHVAQIALASVINLYSLIASIYSNQLVTILILNIAIAA